MGLKILGIETSCDETAIGVVEDGVRLRSNIIASQVALHSPHGGVVPEVASRQHIRDMVPALETSLSESGLGLEDLDLISVTYGPGLAGSLITGLNTAKALAFSAGIPLVGVNHLEGTYTPPGWFRDGPARPKIRAFRWPVWWRRAGIPT